MLSPNVAYGVDGDADAYRSSQGVIKKEPHGWGPKVSLLTLLSCRLELAPL
jgi:hypothetical protein